MRVTCISCGHDLNLDHAVFHDYSGPVKCFSCSTLMELKTTGGEVSSISALAAFRTEVDSGAYAEKRI
jgi:ribosomal protein S27E